MTTSRAKDFFQTAINPNARPDLVEMWVGPRSRDEIEKAMAGDPTTVACAVGPNINDGTGTRFYEWKKGFKTMKQYQEWVNAQTPQEPTYACPYCEKGPFTGKSELATHISSTHSHMSRSSSDFRQGDESIDKPTEEEEAEIVEEKPKRRGRPPKNKGGE